MHQAVDDAALGVELQDDFVEQSGVPTFLSAKYSVSDEVRQLQQTCRLRTGEKWHVREVLDGTAVSGPEASVLA